AAVGTFGNCLDPADRPAFPKRNRHRAFIMRQGLAVEAKKPPEPAPTSRADLGPAAPEFRGRFVVIGNATLVVRDVNRHAQPSNQASVDHTYSIPRRPQRPCGLLVPRGR